MSGGESILSSYLRPASGLNSKRPIPWFAPGWVGSLNSLIELSGIKSDPFGAVNTPGDQLFGLPISRVQDVFVPDRLTRVPLAPP